MKHTRRKFLAQILATGVVMPYTNNLLLAGTKKKPPLGVILGLLDKQLREDYKKTLSLISSLGCSEVEFGGTYGAEKADFRQALNDNNLTAVAGAAHPSRISMKTSVNTSTMRIISIVPTSYVIGHGWTMDQTKRQRTLNMPLSD